MDQYRSELVNMLADSNNDNELLSVFHSMILDESEQDGAATAANSNHLIKTLVDDGVLKKRLSTLWEETDGCAESYWCATALFLLSSVAFTQDIIIDWMVGAPGHGKGVVDGLNAVDKTFLRDYMSKISVPGVVSKKKQWMPMIALQQAAQVWQSYALIC